MLYLKGICWKWKWTQMIFRCEWISTCSRKQSHFLYNLFNVSKSPCFNGHSLPDHSSGFSLFRSMESIILTSCNVVGAKWIPSWRRSVITVLWRKCEVNGILELERNSRIIYFSWHFSCGVLTPLPHKIFSKSSWDFGENTFN